MRQASPPGRPAVSPLVNACPPLSDDGSAAYDPRPLVGTRSAGTAHIPACEQPRSRYMPASSAVGRLGPERASGWPARHETVSPPGSARMARNVLPFDDFTQRDVLRSSLLRTCCPSGANFESVGSRRASLRDSSAGHARWSATPSASLYGRCGPSCIYDRSACERGWSVERWHALPIAFQVRTRSFSSPAHELSWVRKTPPTCATGCPVHWTGPVFNRERSSTA
jgi:hypothetical protein